MEVGKSPVRVDGYDKATGRTKYTDDLCDKGALIAKIKHSTIAHGFVKSVDTFEAEKIPGVVKIVTCFDVPDYQFPTAGHPWSTDPSHQDISDRLLLEKHIRYYGDDVAAVVAETEIAANQAVRALKVEYEELPFVLDAREALKEGAPIIHEERPNNVVGHGELHKGNYEEAIKEPGLIKVEGWYCTPTVQHSHIENAICYAYQDKDKIVVVSSTQIPHIVRRVCGQALGIPWGSIRVIKPYVGGGFGDKQDALYEPLCAFLCTQVGGRLVKLDCTREETFMNCRVRHAIDHHIISWVRPNGDIVARKVELWSNQGGYASHGHSICAKDMGHFAQLYPCPNIEAESWTVYTNRQVAGAMRGYGMPQGAFANDSNIEDICRVLDVDPVQYRRDHVMSVGFTDPFSKNELYSDTFNQVFDKGCAYIDWDRKRALYNKPQTGSIRRGVGMATFWYNTAVYPISLETSTCRMVMNQDGSIQVMLGETEIGQGQDTSASQMVADTIGVPLNMVHVISCQDTDAFGFGTGVYASRGTYVTAMAIRGTGEAFKQKILERAFKYTRMQYYLMDIRDGNIVRVTDGRILMSLGELATASMYDKDDSMHLTMEKTTTLQTNAYSFGCCFAEVEVDIELCKVKILNIINVHDVGRLINPDLAEAQVHGGMSMGIGFALSEKMVYDKKTGRLLNGNLLDYKLSTFMDHPHLEAQFVENPEPTGAFGTKGLGEPPVCPVGPAIRNAILQATDVPFYNLPIDPHQMYERFVEEGLIEGGDANV